MFPTSRLQTTHLLSLQALLAIINSIESSCVNLAKGDGQWLAVASEKYGRLAKEAFLKESRKEPLPTQTGSSMSISPMQSEMESSTKTTVHRSVSCSPVLPSMVTSSGLGNSPPSVGSKQEGTEDSNQQDGCYTELPSPDDLMHLRQRKKLLLAGSDDFNIKASKGIHFLEEKGLISGECKCVCVWCVCVHMSVHKCVCGCVIYVCVCGVCEVARILL